MTFLENNFLWILVPMFGFLLFGISLVIKKGRTSMKSARAWVTDMTEPGEKEMTVKPLMSGILPIAACFICASISSILFLVGFIAYLIPNN